MKGLTDQLQEGDDRADMTPMIDCIFLLLLFFIVTATFSEENIFDVDLPEAAQPVVREGEEVVQIYILKDGGYSIGSRTVTEETLLPTLRAIHQRQPIKSLVIKGDRRVTYDKVVKVVDIAHSLRITEFSLAVDREL